MRTFSWCASEILCPGTEYEYEHVFVVHLVEPACRAQEARGEAAQGGHLDAEQDEGADSQARLRHLSRRSRLHGARSLGGRCTSKRFQWLHFRVTS